MSIDRVATSAQTAYFLSHIQTAGHALDKTQESIASGKNANTYAGFGDRAQVLTATIAAQSRNAAYANATKFAVTQTDMQDTQLTSLSSLAALLKKAVSDAVANNDGSTLMAQVQSIFDQASAILNSKDANGDYIYSGGKTDVAPVSVNSLSALRTAASTASTFANGDLKKSIQVADGVTVPYGMAASDIGTGLMDALRTIAISDNGANFTAGLSSTQNDFLSGMIGTVANAATDLNAKSAANGYVSNRLSDAQTQQEAMTTLYKGFVSNIQDTNMADAATQLSLNQTQLQAALQVTAGLHQLSLLNFLSPGG
jgi:flagellar hook-associated protein 3 FlgL